MRPLTICAAIAIGLIACRRASAQSSANAIRVVVSGMRNDHGLLDCALYKGPAGFAEAGRQFRETDVQISHGVGVCEFKDVPAGTYAATVLDDENQDHKMDFNWIGWPTKGYGFSNDAKATLSAPSFDSASFKYSGSGVLPVPIKIVYR
jgi:uncharacterized protein (DUF2141 family)